MVASLDRAAFYAAVRKTPFGGSLSQRQVDGLNALLDACPPAMETAPLAYCLATTKHETGHAMWPVLENLSYSTAARIRQVWPSRFLTEASAQPYVRNPQTLANKVYGGRLGNKLPNDGWDFRGMGDVQATGRDNARRATGRLRDLGYLTRAQDLEVTPTLMLDPFIAAAMLYTGLSEGWYTGKKLSDYFGPGRDNPTAARAMVNPDNEGASIAVIYASFKAALIAAGHKANAAASSVPRPPVSVSPLEPLTPTAEAIEKIQPPPIASPTSPVRTRLGNWLATKLTNIWSS
ncbi:hypothetical protein HCU64_06445 [Methylobacterium sp. C25]|uniref:hypothetical protein n=1 Tax=Methylobacterium sp. C25 TaxID=2721622 RepID=UPI001F35BA57|nr:hypothetical protein [Methylobacterium sp. C25]MCE4223385.1 hypothetical protein [Methylobacterium sp. C25]